MSIDYNVAIIFKGISYIKQYIHWSGKKYGVDFRNNYENINHCLFKRFNNKDIYYITYDHEYINDLKELYNPKKIRIIKKEQFLQKQYVLKQIKSSLQLLENINYDFYIITRFDINLKSNFDDIIEIINSKNISITDKIWFLCKASDPDTTRVLNDDTFIIVPHKYLDIFKETIDSIIEENKLLGHHLIYDKIKEISDFIYDEYHLIVDSRPYIKFNREISYNISNIIQFDELVLYPYIKYNVNIEFSNEPCYILCKNENEFKLNGKKGYCEIHFNTHRRIYISSNSPVCINGSTYINNIELELKVIKLKLHNNIINFKFKDTKIHFVSFYTEGPPNDKCLNMTNVMNRYLSLLKPYIDSHDIYTPRRLKENTNTSHLVSEYKVQNPYNPGVHNIGYLKWKPYIILEKLKNINDNEIVYYRDSNIIKYPVMINGINETRELIEFVLKDNDIFVPIENYPELKMKHNVKREIFEEIGKYNDNYLEEFMFNTSIVICKKTKRTVELMEKWLYYCNNDRLLTYTIHIRQHPEMHHNVQEQSILNVILKKENILGKYSLNYRDFSFNKLTKIPRIAVLIIGEMRTFDNNNVIINNNKHLFDKYNCDIFVSTWNKRGFSFNHGNIINKYRYEQNINEDMIKKVYKRCKGINIEDYDEWLNNLNEEYKIIYDKGLYNGDIKCPSSSFPQFYKLKNANQMKINYEKENNFEYDIVIKFRPDMCIINDIEYKYIYPYTKLINSLNTFNHESIIYHLNPPAIYDPSRIYDIFFMSSSKNINILSESYDNILTLIEDNFDNGLDKVNPCRLLYLQAIKNNIKVEDIPFCIGDIYRGENFNDYIDKINIYNYGYKEKKEDKEPIIIQYKSLQYNTLYKKFGRLNIKI